MQAWRNNSQRKGRQTGPLTYYAQRLVHLPFDSAERQIGKEPLWFTITRLDELP
jgi:hypothetical protein